MKLEFFTVEEIAKILKISSRTVFQLIYDKKLRASKVAKCWRIERSDLEAYLKENQNTERIAFNEYFKDKGQ